VSSKIVALPGIEISETTGQPEGVVELLEELLEDARRGEIKAIAVVVCDPADKIKPQSAGATCRHQLMAGAVYLQHHLAARD
jgi:hypothetical protein